MAGSASFPVDQTLFARDQFIFFVDMLDAKIGRFFALNSAMAALIYSMAPFSDCAVWPFDLKEFFLHVDH